MTKIFNSILAIETLLNYFELTFKEKIFNQFLELLNEKIIALRQTLADLKASSENETKSTAGDKHETALAMLQIEQANTHAQLEDLQNKKAALLKIDAALISDRVVTGSLVKTNRGYFFISIAAGKLIIDGKTVIAISISSPLGKLLIGSTKGDNVIVNNLEYKIENVQ